MIAFLSFCQVRRGPVVVALIAAMLSVIGLPLGPAAQAQNTYTIFTAEGRRTLTARPSGSTDMVPLDQVASLFGLTVAEDPAVGGVTITGRSQRILAIPGQSFVQVAGRVESLSAPVQRDRGGWQVPIDFISKAVGPAIGTRIEVRRATRLILVGDVRVPQITTRFERAGPAGRLIIDVLPGTPHRVTREGERLIVRFDAPAIDARGVSGLPGEFVASARVEGTSLIFELGPSATNFQAETERDQTRLNIELSPTPTEPAAPPQEAPPAIDLPSGGIRTVVIDPGHGGDDTGARGPRGTLEKDVTLQMARRLKAAIESRMGLRVLLTRDSDENVPIDRRTALANYNKADLFFSLHANAAAGKAARGAQVLSLALEDYRSRLGTSAGRAVAVPMIGGGARTIEAVPWELAQLPFAERSAALASILVRQLTERGVRRHARQTVQLPLRVLVGANMPAIMIEMGFLSTADDERALAANDLPNAVIEAITATIAEVRKGALGQNTGAAR